MAVNGKYAMAQVVAFVSIEMSKKREEGRFSRLVPARCLVCYDTSIHVYVLCLCVYIVRATLAYCYVRFRRYSRKATQRGNVYWDRLSEIIGSSRSEVSQRRIFRAKKRS